MIRTLATVFLVVGLATSARAASPWVEDWGAAQKAARESHKLLLVEATGSDWCLPGAQMQAEVFDRPDFLPAATAQYILVRLDYPKNLTQPERIRAQNQELAERYAFRAFPTYLIVDPQGFVWARHAGLIAGGVTAFLQWTASAEGQRTTLTNLMAAVAKAPEGPQRAAAQDALFRQAEAWGLEGQYADLPLQIVRQDKEGQAGLKGRYQVYNAYRRRLATWSQDSDFRRSAQEFGDLATRAGAWPDLKQRIVFTQGMVCWNALNDEVQARDLLRVARDLDPTSSVGQQAAELLDHLP